MWQLGSPNYGDQTISEIESQACHYKDSQIFLKSSRVPGTVICLINMTVLLCICICTNEWIIWINDKSINQLQVVFPESGCLPLFAPLPLPLPPHYFICFLRQPLSSAQADQIGHWFIPVKWPWALTSLFCSGGFPFSFTDCSTIHTADDFSNQRRTAI